MGFINLSLDYIPSLSILIGAISVMWALSVWSTRQESAATTMALTTSALALALALAHHHHHHQKSSLPTKTMARRRSLPTFLDLDSIGIKKADSAHINVALSSTNGTDSIHHTLRSLQSNVDQTGKGSLGTQLTDSLDSYSASDTTTSMDPKSVGDVLEVISPEAQEAQLMANAKHRIWDHVVVGESREALEAALRLAKEHPSRLILALVERDIQPNLMQRIVQWSQRILAAQAQGLWTMEAMGALPATWPQQRNHQCRPIIELTTEDLMTAQLDFTSLPPNLSIGSGVIVTRILIDKEMTNIHTPQHSPRPLKRFSSIGGQKNGLVINTVIHTLPRIVGLDCSINSKGSLFTDIPHRLLCKNGVVFTNPKGALLQALDLTPAVSSQEKSAGGLSNSVSSEDQSRWPRMVFSIPLQYNRRKASTSSLQQLRYQSSSVYQSLLQRFFETLEQFDCALSKTRPLKPTLFALQPVMLHQSEHVHQDGRVRPRAADEEGHIFGLQISVSTSSLNNSSKVQILVRVVTDPVAQDAFGNSEMIRKGEEVLMEGLALARDLANNAGWTCIAEDDSQMVEWVRDQMDIHWIASTDLKAGPSLLTTSFPSIEGLHVLANRKNTPGDGVRIKTPTLSPYTSRASSYRGNKREEANGDHLRDSTLKRLEEAAETLKTIEEPSKVQEEVSHERHSKRSSKPKSKETPVVTIAAVESSASTAQRPGLVTSFGGFSSLNTSRNHILALAESTEDHLELALSVSAVTPPPPAVPSLDEGIHDPKTFFSQGLTAELNGGTVAQKPAPVNKKLSRFSIKSYQMERSNTGLSDDWGLASLDSTPVTPLPAPNPLALSALDDGQFLTDQAPVTDFLLDSDPFAGVKVSKKQDEIKTDSLTERKHPSTFFSASGTEPLRKSSEGINQVDNGSRRSFGSYGSYRIGGGSSGASVNSHGSSNGNRSGSTSPQDGSFAVLGSTSPTTAADEVPDFLGGGFISPNAELNRIHSSQSVGSTTTKAVHFADMNPTDHHRRVESEPHAHTGLTAMGMHSLDRDDEEATERRPALSSNVSASSVCSFASTGSESSSVSAKSKNHSRRSWGQGIGGHDIQGIQGLE